MSKRAAPHLQWFADRRSRLAEAFSPNSVAPPSPTTRPILQRLPPGATASAYLAQRYVGAARASRRLPARRQHRQRRPAAALPRPRALATGGWCMSSSVSRHRDDTADAFDGSGSLRTVRRRKRLRRPSRALPAIHKFNGIVATAIVVLLLAPIPLGSNRPAFWMIWSTSSRPRHLPLRRRADGPARPAARRPLEPVARADPATSALRLGRLPDPARRRLDAGAGSACGGLATTPRSISLDPGSAQLVLIQFFTFGLLYLLTVQVAINRRRARRMLLAIFLIVVAFAGYGLISLTELGDTLLGFEKQIYQGYATATFINRNSFATFLAVGLTTGVAYGMQLLADRKALTATRLIGMLALILLGMAFIAAALLATGSRLGTASALGRGRRGPGAGGAGLSRLVTGVSSSAPRRCSCAPSPPCCCSAPRCSSAPCCSPASIPAAPRSITRSGPPSGPGHGPAMAPAASPRCSRRCNSRRSRPSSPGRTATRPTWRCGSSSDSSAAPSRCCSSASPACARCSPCATPPARRCRSPASAAIAVFATHSLLDFPAEIEANAFLLVVLLGLGAAGAVNGHQARRHANTASALP